MHTIPGLERLSEGDKQALKCAAKDIFHSPNHRITFTDPSDNSTQTGYLCGWEWTDVCRRTGQVVVWSKSRRLVLPTSEVKSTGDPIAAPWFRPSVHVYKSEIAAGIMDTIFKKQVLGLKATFNDIFQKMFDNGIAVFVVGGAIRDVLQGMQAGDINDIDMSFDCSARELEDLAKKEGWQPVSVRPSSGLVQLGTVTPGQLYLEGKHIFGHNSDTLVTSPGVRCSGADLTLELFCRDFTVNALFYDPINRTIVDISGCGVQDATNKILRIPVEQSMWETWVNGNPSKLLRYYKFMSRGYTPACEETRKFIMRKWQELTCPDTAADRQPHQDKYHPTSPCYLTPRLLRILYGNLKPKEQAGFKQAMEADLGADFFKKHFG